MSAKTSVSRHYAELTLKLPIIMKASVSIIVKYYYYTSVYFHIKSRDVPDSQFVGYRISWHPAD